MKKTESLKIVGSSVEMLRVKCRRSGWAMAPSKPAVVLEPEYYQPYSCSDSGGTVYGCPRWCDTQRSVWQFLSLVQFLDVEGDVIRSDVAYDMRLCGRLLLVAYLVQLKLLSHSAGIRW